MGNPQRMVVVALAAMAAMAVCGPAAAQDRARQQDACEGWREDGKAALAACTALIDSPETESHGLAYAFYNRGLAHHFAGNQAAAIADLTEAIGIEPLDPAYRFARGHVHQQMRAFDPAIEDLGLAIRLKPTVMAYIVRGAAYTGKGDFSSAFADFDAAVRLDPDNAAAHFNRGILYRRRGDLDAAIADFDAAVRLAPDNPDNRRWRDESVRARDAAKGPAAAPTGQPDDAAALLSRGLASFDKGDTDRAFADFDKAVELAPDIAATYFYRGKTHSRRGNNEAALADLTRAIELDDKDADYFFERGRLYDKSGDKQRALADLNAAIRLKPDHFEALRQRSAVNFDLRRFDEAFADSNAAVRLRPHDFAAIMGRATDNAMLGRYEQAFADFNEAIRLNPRSAIPYRSRGIVYQIIGRPDQAIADFDEAVRLDPDNPDNRRLRDEAVRAKAGKK